MHSDRSQVRTQRRIALGVVMLLLLPLLATLPLNTAGQPIAVGAARELVPTALADTPVRFATFNAALNRNSAGQLISDLSTPDNAQAQAVAEIIQRTNPDVLLINEFDYDEAGQAAQLFQDNYLAVSQNGADPIEFPYTYVAPSNTGVPSGQDFDNSGDVGGPGDAFGFGFFPGQFGMLLYSKYPIVTEDVRTFQTFLWKDMPDALLPDDPATPAPADWYTPEELEVFRLSSKSHWDVPINVDDTIIHALVSHPTPPVFDDPPQFPAGVDFNGRRNHDEIRFWADYVTPGAGAYIYDDAGATGGLAPGSRFVVMGDQNADPNDGDSTNNAILQLLSNPLVNTIQTPTSAGGPEQAELQGGANADHTGNPAFDTADFADTTPGNLRADYVLPSVNLKIADAGVFWPKNDDPLFALVGLFDPTLPAPNFPSSDHRLVWVDVEKLSIAIASGDTTQTTTMLWVRSTSLGSVTFEYAADASFATILGTETAEITDLLLPVKVAIADLMPDTTYYYRVTDATGTTAVGQFRTAAVVGTRTGLRFGVVGDWQQAPPFPSLANAAERDLAFFLKHGDTIYADLETPALPGVSQARTLEHFRTKHAENVSDRYGLNTLQDLYATTSILATIDDHEVVDNFAGGAAPGDSPDAPDIGSSPDPLFTDPVDFVNDTRAYEDALQAFQEYHPIRDEFYGDTGDARTARERKLYRARSYGSDAALFVLDTRSFRDAQIEPVDLSNPLPFFAAAFEPGRTLLGRQQLEDLKTDLLQAHNDGSTWKFIAVPEPIQNFGPLNAEDRFEGYAAERTELLKFIDDNAIDNVVFFAADFHGTIVNNLTYQSGPGQPQIPTGAFEIVTGPAAFFSGRFGPNVVTLAAAAGLITPEQRAIYDALPIAPDPDDVVNDKDDFVKQLLIGQTSPLGYPAVGLQDSEIDATLLRGDYLAAHSFGWTEVEIDAETQVLTVTVYGIAAYSEEQLVANPDDIVRRTPAIVSQFRVTPKPSGTVLFFPLIVQN